jgi:hypothetical protein
MQDYAGSEGAKIVWAATNPDETAIYVMMDVPNPEFMQTFLKGKNHAQYVSNRKYLQRL